MGSNSVEWWSLWADRLSVLGLSLGTVVALVAVVGWFFSSKAGKLKDEELDHFKTESKQLIREAEAKSAEANKIAAIANEKAEYEKLERLKLEEK